MNKGEKSFHLSRVAFMIIDNKVIYLENSKMSHKEWYKSLGLPIENFNNIVRGYYKNGQLVFYKGEFIYDDEVIEASKKYSKNIEEHVGDNNPAIYVGVIVGKIGEEWLPDKKMN